MFENIGKKLMGLANFFCWGGIIISIVGGFIVMGVVDRGQGLGLAIMVGGSLVSWLSSWAVYAFGQITDDVHAMREAANGSKAE